jgi:hypothetical protein
MNTYENLTLVGIYFSNVKIDTTMPIIAAPSDATRKTFVAVDVPAQPGDILDIVARGRVTDNASMPRYNTSISFSLYQPNDASGAVHPIGKFNGSNDTANLHHLPTHISTIYVVPATWDPAVPFTVSLRGTAASTAWRAGDNITIDDMCEITVRRYVTTP